MKTIEDIKSLQTEAILRLNCPGFGRSLSLNKGEAQPLTEYSVIIVNPVSIVHLFSEEQNVLRQVEMAQGEGLTSCRLTDDKILERISQQIELRSPELFQFLAQGGLLIYYLCRPFVVAGQSSSLDNYAWLCGLAPDQSGESTMSEQTVRHMSAVAHGRNVDRTSATEQSKFRPYFEQVGLEWSTIIRTDFLTSGYTVLAQAGPKKCIAGELIAGDKGGRVIFLPAPYSPDFDRVLIACIKTWYAEKMGLPDETQNDNGEEVPEESNVSKREKADSIVATILADQAAATVFKTSGQGLAQTNKRKETIADKESLSNAETQFKDVATPPEHKATKQEDTAVLAPQVSIKQEEIAIPKPQVSIKQEEIAIPKPQVSIKQEEIAIPTLQVSTKQEEIVILAPKVPTNQEKIAILTPQASIKQEEAATLAQQVATRQEEAIIRAQKVNEPAIKKETIISEQKIPIPDSKSTPSEIEEEPYFDWEDSSSEEADGAAKANNSSRASANNGPAPAWCKSYWLPGVDGIIKEIQVIRKQIKDLEKKLASNENTVSSIEAIKSTLLSGKPGDLLASSGLILDTLGWQSKVNEEDTDVLVLERSGQSEAVVRTAISPGPADRKELARLTQTLIKFWDRRGSEPKGILIVCTFCDTPVVQRKEADFSEVIIEFAKRKNICLIATTQLIGLYLDVKLGKLNAQNARETILSTSGKLGGFAL